ncbi:hypothetical protein AB0H77_27160 [Streptomyces sp. NPDC050844]|uniref:hypothetical protein n=1 Tax=Streptomyces sp. NPDC050844 TaxID=3155790 RepID=UPI0033FCB5F5
MDPAEIGGIAVEHWRRGDILDWLAERPGPGTSPGRPSGSRNRLPLGQISTRAAEILADEPTITAARVAQMLGINTNTAQRAVAEARHAAVRRLLEQQPELTAQAICERLGYPGWAARRALETARAPPAGTDA